MIFLKVSNNTTFTFVRIEDVQKGAITGIEVKLAIGAFKALRAVLDTVLGNETTPFG